MDLKRCSLLVLLVLAVMPSYALMHDSFNCVLAGGLLVASLVTGNKCVQDYKLASAKPSFVQKVQQWRYKNNENSMKHLQYTVKGFIERYGTTLGWGAATIILGAVGLKILYKCIKG